MDQGGGDKGRRASAGRRLSVSRRLYRVLVEACRVSVRKDKGEIGGDDVLMSLARVVPDVGGALGLDRKSTRLNSSHANISYAVFCLKKKKNSALLQRQTHT